MGRLLRELKYTQIDEIIAQGLQKYLDGLQTQMNRVDDALFETFFCPAASGSKRRTADPVEIMKAYTAMILFGINRKWRFIRAEIGHKAHFNFSLPVTWSC